jgi:hypothetical protein
MYPWSVCDNVFLVVCMCLYVQRNRNPFVDYPWLMDIFEVMPSLPELRMDCGALNYTGDPHHCDYQDSDSPPPTGDATAAPSASPGPRASSRPTSAEEGRDVGLEVGDIAVIAFNSGGESRAKRCVDDIHER